MNQTSVNDVINLHKQMEIQRKKMYQKEYYQRPEVKQRRKLYYHRPEVKLKQKLYYQEYYKRKRGGTGGKLQNKMSLKFILN